MKFTSSCEKLLEAMEHLNFTICCSICINLLRNSGLRKVVGVGPEGGVRAKPCCFACSGKSGMGCVKLEDRVVLSS